MRRPPPAVGATQRTPGARIESAGPPLLMQGMTSGPVTGSLHSAAPSQECRSLSGGIDHPDADDVGVAGGPGEAGDLARVAGRGHDGETLRAGAGEEPGGDGVLRVAEPRSNAVVGQAEVQDVDSELFTALERPVDSREDVRGERPQAAVPGAEDLEGDDRGLRRDPLGSGRDAGDGGAVPVTVVDVGVSVREVPSAHDPAAAGRVRAEVGVEEVDSRVDDGDRASGSRDPGREEPVGADLGHADLAGRTDDAIQDDGPGLLVAFEPREARGRQPARENPAVREGPNDLEARRKRGGAGSGLLSRDEDPDSSAGRQLLPDPAPDVELRRRGVRREGGRGQDRGREEGACGAEGTHGKETEAITGRRPRT